MNGPFDGLSKLQMQKLFVLLGVHKYKYNKLEELISTIKHENLICIIISGHAQIMYIEYNGNEIVMEDLYENNIFGTNISATNNDNCQIIAREETEIWVIDYNRLMNINNLQHNYFNIFFRNLFDIINVKFKERNERISILEKKQIRDRLLEYFEIQYKKSRSKFVYLPFSLKDLADYLSVNRSAMFREIKHLKDDKLIEVKDKRITLLYKLN